MRPTLVARTVDTPPARVSYCNRDRCARFSTDRSNPDVRIPTQISRNPRNIAFRWARSIHPESPAARTDAQRREPPQRLGRTSCRKLLGWSIAMPYCHTGCKLWLSCGSAAFAYNLAKLVADVGFEFAVCRDFKFRLLVERNGISFEPAVHHLAVYLASAGYLGFRFVVLEQIVWSHGGRV